MLLIERFFLYYLFTDAVRIKQDKNSALQIFFHIIIRNLYITTLIDSNTQTLI